MIAVILSCSPAIVNCFTIPSICHFPQKLHATQQSIILEAPKRKTKEQQIYNSKYFKGRILALLIELVGEVPEHERRDNRVRHLNKQREIERRRGLSRSLCRVFQDLLLQRPNGRAEEWPRSSNSSQTLTLDFRDRRRWQGFFVGPRLLHPPGFLSGTLRAPGTF